MTVRKIAIDNSVRYVKKSSPQNEQTRESKPNMIKNKSVPPKQSKDISQNNKKFLNNISASGFGGFGILTK